MVKNYYYVEMITSIYFKTKKVRLNLALTKVSLTIRCTINKKVARDDDLGNIYFKINSKLTLFRIT